MAVPVPGAVLADPFRTRRAQRFLQFLLDDDLNCAPNPLPHHLFQRAFSRPCAPTLLIHSVILRNPPSSGFELWLNSPDLEGFRFSTNLATLPFFASREGTYFKPFGAMLREPPWPPLSTPVEC